MEDLNKALSRPWYEFNGRSRIFFASIFVVGLVFHGINTADKFAPGNIVKKVNPLSKTLVIRADSPQLIQGPNQIFQIYLCY